MLSLPKWQRGRQNTGYEKLRLFESQTLKMDLWLLRAAPGVEVPPHCDPVKGFRHYRANLILRKAQGGNFFAHHPIINLPRLKVFRSDSTHYVTHVEAGTRLVLSFGWLRKE